ncbi:MAG: Asp-tRNA(Asn)/Glu-tRNA(Gln) amidotransferase subunit GatC [Candidatus Longimicrobiales bacterium M2_2A_002]
MSISADEVRRIAALAALELSDDEVDRLAGELSDTLGHFEVIRDADGAEDLTAEGAERAEGPGSGARLRPDEPVADRLEADPAAEAPGWMAGFFTVPRLGSHGAADDADTADSADSADSPASGGRG